MTDASVPSLIDSASYRVAFTGWFGLRPAETSVLVALYHDKRVGYVPAAELAILAEVTLNAIPVHVSCLRKALEAEAIDTERNAGYRLTDEGRAECRAALWSMGEELRRAL